MKDGQKLVHGNQLTSEFLMGSSDSFTNFEFRIYEFVLTNVCYELLFIRQTEKKKLVSFLTAQTKASWIPVGEGYA